MINEFCDDVENDIIILGIDEAGRGPLFGRVYTSCVILPSSESNFDLSLIKDSKKFSSKKKLNQVADYIKDNCLYYSIDYEDENTIDKINILQATIKSMKKSITNVINKILENNKNIKVETILNNILCRIDGNYFKPFHYIYNDEIYIINYETLKKGDQLSKSIGAASILAKDSRDNYIKSLCEEIPYLDEYYSLSTNMGYGTKKHMDGIDKYGITKYHRKTFCKNKKLIIENN